MTDDSQEMWNKAVVTYEYGVPELSVRKKENKWN
jgi:hypothetical protein